MNKPLARKWISVRSIAFVATLLLTIPFSLFADTAPQTLPFTQDWTNTGMITTVDDWSGVPGITGYRGDGLTGATGVDPQTVIAASTVVDVNQNQTNPNTFTTGGVTEFEIANPVVAIAGSGTARAPYISIFLNTTGQTSVRVRYTLRDIDASTDNAVQQVALQYRVGATGNFVNIPAGYVPDASTGPSLAVLTTAVCAFLPVEAENQPLVEVRVITTDAGGSDEWIGIDDIEIASTVVACPPPPTPPTAVAAATPDLQFAGSTTLLTVAVTPGTNPPSSGITVTGNLSAIGGANPQTLFDDGTNGDVTGGDNIYSFLATIAAPTTIGAKTLTFTVRDAENRSTSPVLKMGVRGTITTIHDIQGTGNASTLTGAITTEGIVTAVRSQGFYIQVPDADVDLEPNSSEGIYIFTSSTPAANVVVGAAVIVVGNISEYIPAADPASPPLTEIVAPYASVVSTGNPLPAAIHVAKADLPPGGTAEQLERLEGMRVHFDTLTAVSPTDGFVISEAGSSYGSTGVFYAVIADTARPFREAGIHVLDPLPAGAPVTIPRFDGNPERVRVDSDAQNGAIALDLKTGVAITNVTGVLDFAFRTWTLLPDPGVAPPEFTNDPVAVAIPGADQITVASMNVERFFDTVDDAALPPASEPVLTTEAFNRRLAKLSEAVRDVLRSPDVIGVEEVENLETLEAIAAKLNADAVTASEPDPLYMAHLVTGNDIGGIDVGFLVKTSRIDVVSVTQVGKDTTYIDPSNGQPALLNDRPPLVLLAKVGSNAETDFPFTVIVNHLRSLNDIDHPTDGARVRAKRKAQAEFLANLVQARQVADPTERIILVGDFNAFEVNDGYVDVIGTILGSPAPATDVVTASDDLVNPNFVNMLSTLPADQRYSYTFDGNAQTLDHIMVSASIPSSSVSLQYGRFDADYAEILKNDGTTSLRLSDHDAPVLFITAGPIADSISPASGPAYVPNFQSTIAGFGFAANAEVTFGALAGEVLANDGASMDVRVPQLPAGTFHDVTVTNPTSGRSSLLPGGFFSEYLDVTSSNPFYNFIIEIARLGITTGCGGGNYCPSLVVPREHMAGFLSRGVAGGDANVPSAGTVNGVAYNCAVGGNSLFTDVPETAYFCRHIHYIANLGITTGCTVAGDIFCPSTSTNRAQMAAFIGRTLVGSDAAIPTAVTLTGGINEWGLPRAYDCGDDAANYFPDVPDSEFFCRQIHYIWARGIVDGYPNGTYGPTDVVLREQMAKFLANAF